MHCHHLKHAEATMNAKDHVGQKNAILADI